MKIMVLYDSLTGNTEEMAKAIAEGADSVVGSVVEIKKIGDPFPLSMLLKADGTTFGSPCIYANVTDNLKSFLLNMKRYVKDKSLDIKNRKAAVFGSYGWDGAWVMEEQLKRLVQDIGYVVKDEVCVETESNIKYQTEETLERCRVFGREFAESVK